MEKYRFINDVLSNTTPVKKNKIINDSFPVQGLAITRIRDVLMKLGKIHTEKLEMNMYVVVIPGGFLKKNYAVVVVQLLDGEMVIASYADEGLINQHTSEGIIDEIKEQFSQYINEKFDN